MIDSKPKKLILISTVLLSLATGCVQQVDNNPCQLTKTLSSQEQEGFVNSDTIALPYEVSSDSAVQLN
ncbi:MAG: hypothetical protein ACRCXZ_09395, partial [Patescibacteria group bacterium]